METKWDKGSVSTVVYTWLDEWLQGVSSMILTAGKKEVPRRQQRGAAANLHSKWNLCVFCFLGREEWNSEQSQYVKQRHSTGKETFFFFSRMNEGNGKLELDLCGHWPPRRYRRGSLAYSPKKRYTLGNYLTLIHWPILFYRLKTQTRPILFYRLKT